MNFSHFVRTDWLYRTIIGFASLCLAQLSNPLRVLSKTQPGWIMNIPAVGLIGSPSIILAMNYWPLVIGLVMRLCRYLCLYTLRPMLYTKSDSDYASNLSPYRLIDHQLYALISLPAKGSVLTQMPQADAGAVRSSASQNQRSIRRTSQVRPKGDIFGE